MTVASMFTTNLTYTIQGKVQLFVNLFLPALCTFLIYTLSQATKEYI